MKKFTRSQLSRNSQAELIDIIQALQKALVVPDSGEKRTQTLSLLMKDILSASITNSPLGLIIWEIKGKATRILEWNRASERIFGWSRNEIIGRDFLKILLIENDIYVFQQIIELFQTNNSPHNYQNECLVKDGGQVIINWFNTPINDRRRKRLFVLSLLEDITERNWAQEALRKTNQTYQALILGAPLAIIILDENWCVKLWNPASETIFGWAEKDVINQPLPILKTGKSDQLKKYLRMIYQGKSFSGIDLSIIRINQVKVEIDFSMAPLTSTEGTINGAILVATDITEKAQALQALSKSEVQNKALLEAIPDLILRIDIKGYVLDSYPSSNQELNKNLSGLVDENLQDSLPSDMADLYLTNIKQVVKESKGRKINFSLSEKKEARIFEARLVPSGKNEILAVIRDVTDEKHQHDRIIENLEAKQKSEHEKTIFLSNISYEILTPLNSILGFIEMLEQQLSDYIGTDQKKLLDSIHQSSNLLMRTVQEMSDLTVISTGKFRLSPVLFSLKDLFEEILDIIQSQIEAKDLKLQVNITSDALMVWADRYTVMQAITHVIDNAVKYTNKGGITINVSDLENSIECSIMDTGVGMTKSQVNNLFELFVQDSDGYQRKFKGLGLGLVLAKRYLDLNDVNIQVNSTRKKGSEFILTFNKPKVETQLLSSEEKDRKTPSRMKKKRPLVLVVEDDANSQRLIQYFLKNEFGMCFAISVTKAKEQLVKKPVDLIILDLSLQGKKDGLDLVNFIREQKEYQQIPIIATTAHISVYDREQCFSAGCNDFLAKPILKKTLLEALMRHL